MRTHFLTAASLVVAAMFCVPARAQFAEGVKLEANGDIIDIKIGHLVPCVTDWNSDGNKDLMVGQFDAGKIRLYLNQGSDSAPAFKDSEFLSAGGVEISLPAG